MQQLETVGKKERHMKLQGKVQWHLTLSHTIQTFKDPEKDT